MPDNIIRIRGARQNNLKALKLDLPLNELIVVTGVSGSGKSSLAFDTVYAEGQRRYVETFSPYARQFFDRMDKPRVERIDGIPPAIAIDQTNPVRTSRSTVGTMSELNDHLKLLYARASALYCRGCGRSVRRDTPDSIADALLGESAAGQTVLITFTITIPKNFTETEIKTLLAGQGYTRVFRSGDGVIEVIQDRIRLTPDNRARLVEDFEAALKHGRGRVTVYPIQAKDSHRLPVSVRERDNSEGIPDSAPATLTPLPKGEGPAIGSGPRAPRRFSTDLHCPDCDIHYPEPTPNLFSFNSPIGACGTCRGFGRVIGIDYDLVIPDVSKTLRAGAIKPWQTASNAECQDDLMRFAKKRGVPTDVPWGALTEKHRRWVIEGEGSWKDKRWYGVERFFKWLEGRAYKMHVRVLLSKYRAYNVCPDCHGARLKPEALCFRLGTHDDADLALSPTDRFKPPSASLPEKRYADLPGLMIHDVICLPLARARDFFDRLHLPHPLDEATELLLGEIRARLRYLVEVGLGYLTLDRQSRTLSGGEVQRIHLTTALGTSLVNTLFVLDEPSIGLHARDMGRVIDVLKRLRDAGNSLLVVEHDAQVMTAADRILDLGPGPGERGGQVMFFGAPAQLAGAPHSLTAQYLTGRKTVTEPSAAHPPGPETAWLEIRGAAEHNLKHIDVRVPLGRLVCLSGVSGSGKSTLMQDVLFHALRKLKGKPVETPGYYHEIHGHEHLGEVVLIDQSPIGRTARSNPASYVGAFAAIRKLFAAEPMARHRGYTAGSFSFNSGNGRCPTCTGSGFEHVEMQFLSDVYLRCPDCDGRRYRAEVLEIKLASRAGRGRANSVSDVLNMTVSEALEFFFDFPEITRVLQPLRAVGLGYVRLGQPVPTLSGGEAQRLKLAKHLAEFRQRENARAETLFLFDEPTTGLHFDDVATLIRALRALIAQGNSVMVIEHNLDVLRAADWIIDLGPEGGEAGGAIVCAGTPDAVARHQESYTGAALHRYNKTFPTTAPSPPKGERVGVRGKTTRTRRLIPSSPPLLPKRERSDPSALRAASYNRAIRVHAAREHNLQNIDVTIPRDRFTVITGVSGSGKSTLAFDILFAEGQRRYLESLNAYARQFVQPAARPDVDAIFGIPPTVAIEQRTSRGGRKSTVATLTEIYHFLRLLFVKLGTQYCPSCELPIEPQTAEAILARVLREHRGRQIAVLAPLVSNRKGYYTDLAKWALAKGYARLRVDGAWTPTAQWPRLSRFREHNIELPIGETRVTPRAESALRALLERALAFGKGVVQIAPSVHPSPANRKGGAGAADRKNNSLSSSGRESKAEGTLFSTIRSCPGCGRSFPELDPRLFSFNSKHGWCKRCYGTGVALSGFDEAQTGEEIWWNEWWEGSELICPECDGQRLNPEALAVRFKKRTISDVTALSVSAAEKLVTALKLRGRAAEVARDILSELRTRLAFLKKVGLSYLTLDRAAPTLSGGEAQRIRLAAQLGSNLRGVCYILDEPTIGLHTRDNRLLLAALKQLRAKGNTVVVVEHDEETMNAAEHLIDLGPGAGANGGHVVAAGNVTAVKHSVKSITGRFLARPLHHPLFARRPNDRRTTPQLEILGATLHNLKNLRVGIPLGRLVCVTGVSGSGKSTLVRNILYDNLRQRLRLRRKTSGKLHGCKAINGGELITRVLEVNQTPIGKTPRSCPATYVGLWDAVRRLFATTPEARLRGYGPGRFSFNVSGGRCATCEGQGMQRIEMSFLPNVSVACETCSGARFTPETLAVRYRDRSIAEVLTMNVDEAVSFFAAHRPIHHALQLLQDVGLGYLTLGQQSPTLSGGEAQRIKLVTELAKTRRPALDVPPAKGCMRPTMREHGLYVLDEPTIGLHMADVEKLIRVLHRLVDAGNTVVVIEHNLDIIAEADWVIDLGPEGGDRGGRLVAQGTPEMVARRGGHTGRVLRELLRARRQSTPVPRGHRGAELRN